MSVADEKIQELDRSFLEFMNKSGNVDLATKEIYEDLLDEVLMGFVFDVHRTVKTGSSDVEEGIPDDDAYTIVDLPGLDVFGQHPIKKSQECSCPNCDRGVAACRFATHLEKCMGMGRNSSRIASRRIANSSKDLSNFSGAISDDDDDADWSVTNDKRKRRRERNGTKRSKPIKNSQKNGDVATEQVHTSNENSPSNYDNMSIEEKRALLGQICGVISEHTKKLCTRSVRCPQHTDDQRKELRANLELSDNIRVAHDNIHIDVDMLDDSEPHFRDSLSRWECEGSNHSSPADSVSITSNSSRKREAKSKSKAKGAKRDRGSPISQCD
ncbi:hypothetical protein PV327_001020 [Microctonus hyperodae]|uniref:SAGA-associated factor 11 homolog n=1 Tax=Microctonus hyperodae TaxID=165561 RepID=A0AA39G7D0_MICHY|nr:hypothetical protein PV327_001020 [Microctonus hyperodae]